MSYYYKRKRKKNYDYDHPDSASQLNKYRPIISDLREYFFSVDSYILTAMFLEYKAEYGENAYKYALKAYPDWKKGNVGLSSQTLLRIIKTLPHFLSENQRIVLLEKLLEYHNKFYPESEFFEATWDDYSRVIHTITWKIKYEAPKKFQYMMIPNNIANEAKWICDEDMKFATKIYNEFLYKKYQIKANGALDSLRLFENTCNRMKANEMIYNDDVSITLDAYTVKYFLRIKRKQKSFFKTIKDFF